MLPSLLASYRLKWVCCRSWLDKLEDVPRLAKYEARLYDPNWAAVKLRGAKLAAEHYSVADVLLAPEEPTADSVALCVELRRRTDSGEDAESVLKALKQKVRKLARWLQV